MTLCSPAPGGQSAASTAQLALDFIAARPCARVLIDTQIGHSGLARPWASSLAEHGASLCNAAITSAQPLLQRVCRRVIRKGSSLCERAAC